MLNPSYVASQAQSIAEVILLPAIRHAEDVTHIHVLQDALQKIRHPRYYTHPDFAIGSTFGQSYYATSECEHPWRYTLEEVITVLRDNLARHDHEDLNTFYQVIRCSAIDYAYRVGFVLGWLTAIIDHDKAPIYPLMTHVA